MVVRITAIFLSVGMLFLARSGLAVDFISPQEAIKEMFPAYREYKVETHAVDAQKVDIFRIYQDNKLMGWAVILNEKGMKEPITFLVGIDIKGTVLDVYVLEYREPHGFEIKEKSFMRQFRGKSADSPLAVGEDIDAVSHATISSKAASRAVKKALQLVNDLRSSR